MSTRRMTEAEMRTAFTMTPEEMEEFINCRADQLTYDVALNILESIADSTTSPRGENTLDRLAWTVRCAFLTGFRDATTLFNDSTIMGIKELFEGGKTA